MGSAGGHTWPPEAPAHQRAGRAPAVGVASLEAQSRPPIAARGHGPAPAQAYRTFCAASADRHANHRHRRQRRQCGSRGRSRGAQRSLRSLLSRRRVRGRHRGAPARFHLAHRRRRARLCAFDYRLAPEHPFPAALEDAVMVYRWLLKEFEPRRIAFVGDSAGGGLLLGTLYKLREEGLALPAAAVAVSPWTDLALTGPSLKLNAAADPMLNVARLPGLASGYLGGADPRNHYASPLYGDAYA